MHMIMSADNIKQYLAKIGLNKLKGIVCVDFSEVTRQVIP